MPTTPTLLRELAVDVSGNTATTASYDTTAGKSLVVVIAASEASGAGGWPEDSITYTGPGGTYTKRAQIAYGVRRRKWVFAIDNPSGASGVGEAIYTGSLTVQEWHIEVYEWNDADSAAPFGAWVAIAQPGGTTLAPTIDVTGAVAGDATMASISLESNVAISKDALWTSLNEVITTNGIRKTETFWDDTADPTPAWSWSGTNGAGGIGVLVKTATPFAYPTIEGTVETPVTTAGTSHAIALPASIVSTDLVLVLMDIGSTAASVDALTDWTEDLDEAVANGLKILRYTGAGVPSNPTFVTSANTRSASIAYRISGADKTIAPQIGTTATGTDANPNPPPVTPAGGVSKDYLFIAFFGGAGEEVDDDTWANTSPTNYLPSPPLQVACGIAGSNLGGKIAAASRQLTTGAAEDPGTFNQDVSTAWRAQTIIIHPIVSGGSGNTVTGTGAINLSTTAIATGSRVLQGTASSPLSLTIIAIGKVAHPGIGVSAVSVTLAAAGKRTVRGTGSSNLSTSATVIGKVTHLGTGATALTTTATAIGSHVIRGTGALNVSATATAAGHRVFGGVGALNVAVTLTADGSVPSGNISGTGALNVPTSATAIGRKTVHGTGQVPVATAATAIGRTVIRGTAATQVTATATATGRTVHPATGATTVGATLTATGQRTVRGTANLLVPLAASAIGNVSGSVAGIGQLPVAVVATAFGKTTVRGVAAINVGVAASATGRNAVQATGAVAISITATATGTGIQVQQGQGEASVAVALTAVGARVVRGTGQLAIGASIEAQGARTVQGVGMTALVVVLTAWGVRPPELLFLFRNYSLDGRRSYTLDARGTYPLDGRRSYEIED